MFSAVSTAHRSQTLFRLVCILLLLAFLAAALPRPASAAPDRAACSKMHVVKDGENIRRIAKAYGIPVARLAKANGLVRPYHVSTGVTLCIPERPVFSDKAKISISIEDNTIQVAGEGFKKFSPFNVKARETDSSSWIFLGKAASGKDGKLKAKISLPKELSGKPFVFVCLKDAVTDALFCKSVLVQ